MLPASAAGRGIFRIVLSHSRKAYSEAVWRQAGADQQIVSMPDLRGNPWQAARQRLAELKLPLLDDGIEANSRDDTKVLDQYPKPAQTIYEGTSVYLVPIQAPVIDTDQARLPGLGFEN